MFQILLFVTSFSPSYNLKMWKWAESKLKYTYKAFQEGIMGKNPSLFRPLIRPAKSGWNSPYSKILYFYTTDSNELILSLRCQNHAIQNPKIVYTPRTTTFMKDVKSDKIISKAKTWMKFEGQDWSPNLMRKLTMLSISLRPRV